MKIAVLFGSFNPLTNAHIAVMKAAVANLDADKGLFVATNEQYLKKKGVKIGDPFLLTQDERQEIIEIVCSKEKNLSFGGFELGGINPNRYKTLCKIQKQYPNATLYEIQGADKVHTLASPKYAEEYLSAIHFAVFERNGINLEQLFNDNPILNAHRDSFVILPALEETADISSTEVRRRFYNSEDYSSLVPNATSEVLLRHKPSDYKISFAERMKIIMKSGRFGATAARMEIYRLNTDLFLRWKAGKSEIDFGDYKEYLTNTVLYDKCYSVTDLGYIYPETQTGCANIDCVDLAEHLINKGYNPAILNLASALKPGGGYRNGMGAQEESLCRSSNLSISLYQFSNPKYANIRENDVELNKIGYPLDMNYGGIYTPNVTFFRNRESNYFTLRDHTFKCDVITVAALSFNGRSHYSFIDELSYRNDAGGFTPEGEEIMLNKIRTIFRMGVEHGKDSLILGAFGCGAYKLPVSDVAKLFRIVMEEPEFKNKFRLITFAILERPRLPHGTAGKFAAFYNEFGAYEMQ